MRTFQTRWAHCTAQLHDADDQQRMQTTNRSHRGQARDTQGMRKMVWDDANTGCSQQKRKCRKLWVNAYRKKTKPASAIDVVNIAIAVHIIIENNKKVLRAQEMCLFLSALIFLF